MTMIDSLRKITPLSLRQLVGPYIGYLVYFYRTRIRGRTWEPMVLTPLETIKKIQAENLSIIRFGDGELSLISGVDLAFQKYDSGLAKRLRQIITETHDGLMIGIPGVFGRLEHFATTGFWFEIHHLFRYANLWKSLTSPYRIYGDAFITRPYLSYKDKTSTGEIYKQLQNLWLDKAVILIEGEKSRLGVGNDLFSGATSVKRILCPAENAYRKIDAIIAAAEKESTDNLILLSLGPAAKIVAYELFKKKYQVLDIGHVDMEYEMFKRNSDHIVPVTYKYFNEIDARDPEECHDPKYQSEIVATIV